MLSRASGKLLRKHKRNPGRVQKHIHGPLRSCSVRPSPLAKQGWVLKQGPNHAKSRNREHGRGMCLRRGYIMSSRASGKQRWVLKQGLNHAKSRIREHGRGGCSSRG